MFLPLSSISPPLPFTFKYKSLLIHLFKQQDAHFPNQNKIWWGKLLGYKIRVMVCNGLWYVGVGDLNITNILL
jgi:hypothetical protein